MKKILISAVLVIVTIIAFTANNTKETNTDTANTSVTISGKVIDLVSGEALTGVGIEIEGSNKKVYSDFDGNYTISNLKPGEYNVIASYISYNKSYIEKIKVNGNEALNIKLQNSK